MPIYEYRCTACRAYHQELVLSLARYVEPACPKCGKQSLRKLVSRFAVMKSQDSRLDDMADPASFGDLDENDPRSVAKWARRMGDSLGEDLGEDFDEMVDRMEAGEMPDETGDGGSADGGDGGDDTF
ncbi:MAG: zinc ribbon domain-containing protein [Chloroflexota bacterium]|nr:MAG: zinc ribbon domain-containing protein [Chloroflexota bacterium]